MASLSKCINPASQCPMCACRDRSILAGPDDREYYACHYCRLVYCDPDSFPDPNSERERYMMHRNSPENEGYLAFLQRAVRATAGVKEIEGDLLDFGCGHTPVLADVLKSYPNIKLALFDPFFYPDPAALNRVYDLVFCIEVVEHFHDPRQSWQVLTDLLKPGAVLTVMTHFLDDPDGFSKWYYARDRTHVCFYQPCTMDWIADNFKLKIIPSGDPRVCILLREN